METKVKKVLEALENENENVRLSDVSQDFTVGDMKELILSAIVEGRMVASGSEKRLKDWQINDNKKWYFPRWLKRQKNKL